MAEMTFKPVFNRGVTSFALAAALAAQTPALAAPPGDLRDLMDVRASSGESALEQRGYHLHHASQGEAGSYTYWWNSQTKKCVRVVTRDGRYAEIDGVDGADCGHKGGGDAGTAAAAIGAAALLGVLALSHKSHHYEDGPRPRDSRQTAEFERGYRDGLYNQSYHNYNRDDFYARGYEQGTRQRDHETSYRPGFGGNGGYGGFVNVSDLNSAQRGYAEAELSRRGFTMIDTNRSDGAGRYTTWWRAASRQCLIVNTRDQYVYSIETARPRNCR